MRLSEELARILPARRRRRSTEAAQDAVGAGVAVAQRESPGDAFDAARERLKSEIPPPDDED